jgi:hypothetical protein
MAKRKAGARTGRKSAAKQARSSRRAPAARKSGGRAGTTRKAAKAARKKTPARKRTVAKTASARAGKAAKTRRTQTRAAAARPSRARRPGSARPASTRRGTVAARGAARRATPKKAPPSLAPRKAPALNRDRRTVREEELVSSTPPSSLDLNRTASAARTGRRELRERYDEHTETGPAITGGDVDADWESAYSVGDEAPGGDSPTPDQDIVDEIGRAVGVQYQDNEELKGEAKIAERDRHRWELDPASSEDYDER